MVKASLWLLFEYSVNQCRRISFIVFYILNFCHETNFQFRDKKKVSLCLQAWCCPVLCFGQKNKTILFIISCRRGNNAWPMFVIDTSNKSGVIITQRFPTSSFAQYLRNLRDNFDGYATEDCKELLQQFCEESLRWRWMEGGRRQWKKIGECVVQWRYEK